MTHQCRIPSSKLVFLVGNFTHTLNNMTKSGERTLCCPHSVSLSRPSAASPRVLLGWEPRARRGGGDDGTNQQLLRVSGRTRREEDDTCHLEVLGSDRFLFLRDLTSPRMECSPSDTHAWRKAEGDDGKSKQEIRPSGG